jgi:dihydroneopterin aldolase
MENIIRIKRAIFYGYHGVYEEEQNVGGKFEADVDIYTDFSAAGKKDSLKQTIDYEKVYKFMYKLALEKKYYLIEALAIRITDQLLMNFESIDKVAVRVRKNNPPVGGVADYVEVEVIKTRKELEE